VLQGLLIVLHTFVSVCLVVFILLHQGKEGGLSGAFGISAGTAGGTQLAEKNLDRLTVGFGVAFFATTVLLSLVI
jgi:preprotein translocase subunit SecG